MIELKHINKIYNGFNALNDISLTIKDGEICGIIGQSGAGKSTLVRCINMLEPPTSGDVIVNGRNMVTLSKRELREERKKIGMIFQHFNLLSSRTVYENVAFPLELSNVPQGEQKERINDILELVGLADYRNKYPAQLSGGQKQRVGIARAIVSNPSVLLSDEATSALDPETVKSILQLLKDINKKLGITIVMITHQMEVVQKICTRMAVMSDGKIVEEGTVKQLFEHPKHTVTRRFVQNVEANQTIEELAESLKKKYPSGKLLRLSFTGNNAEQPTIINAARLVPFEISIVESNISQSSVGPMGVTYIHISGGIDSDYNKFVTYLTDNNVIVEVL